MCVKRRAGEAAQAGGADSSGHASPQGPRQNRPNRRQLPILNEPTSWYDRNRAEQDLMRAASRSEGMTATAPESAISDVSPAAVIVRSPDEP